MRGSARDGPVRWGWAGTAGVPTSWSLGFGRRDGRRRRFVGGWGRLKDLEITNGN